MKYNGENLQEVLDAHARWLHSLTGGEASRADFDYANLIGVDLKGVNLENATMRFANLRSAELSGANLTNASLKCAKLNHAKLVHTNCTGAFMYRVSLCNANIISASFLYAGLTEANLYGVKISSDTKFDYARLNGAKNVPYIPMACPESGSFVAWKKCIMNKTGKYVIVKLLIPSDAKRSSATTRKCRASKAEVIEIQSIKGDVLKDVSTVISGHDYEFKYTIGAIVEPKESFCEDRFEECAPGIHFFMNRQDAVMY